MSVVVATRQPWFTGPSRFVFGTTTSVKKTSLKWWWPVMRDRKSTRLNSSHYVISYAVFCLKKKITEFLAPYFFFTIGSRLNPQLFTNKVLDAAIIVSFLAIISKVAGCGLPLLREGRATVLRVGFGMMPRGEVALIVALVGLQSQIVTPTTYAIVVFMTGITTLLEIGR